MKSTRSPHSIRTKFTQVQDGRRRYGPYSRAFLAGCLVALTVLFASFVVGGAFGEEVPSEPEHNPLIVEGPAYTPVEERLFGAIREHEAREAAAAPPASEEKVAPKLKAKLRAVPRSTPSLQDTGLAIRTRYTLVEASAVHEGETITEYWDDPDAGAGTFIAQYDGRAELYDYGDDSFYVAFVDATCANGANTEFVAADFVRDNLAGEVLEGCTLDPESGVAFIPKTLLPEPGSDEPIKPIQVQLLLGLDPAAGLNARVHVAYENHVPGLELALEEGYVASEGFDGTFTIPVATPDTAALISLADIRVRPEGTERRLPLDADNAYYDPATGELELAAAGIGISGLTVEIGAERNPAESLVDGLLGTTPAMAVSGSDMNFYPWGALTLTDAMEKAFREQTIIRYEGKQGSTNYGREEFVELEKLHKSIGDSYMIYNGFNETEYTWAEVQERSEEVWSSWPQAWRMLTLPGDAANSKNYSLGTAEDWAGLKSSTGGTGDIWMPLNCSHGARPTALEGGVVEDGIMMRILEIKTDVEQPYVVISFCTDHLLRDEAAEQAATGIVKFHLLVDGDLSLTKASTSAQISKDNPCYSLKGAVFGVYREAGCTTEIGRITTDGNGKGKLEGIRAGDVWVKEIKASAGFALDVQAHRVRIEPNKEAHIDIGEVPQNNPIGVLIQKLDCETKLPSPLGRATLAGAEFTVHYYANTTGDTSGSPTRTWVLKTDASGRATLSSAHKVSGDAFYTDSKGRPCLPLGTVTIRETKAPEGYLLSDGSVKKQIITSEGTKETVKVFAEPDEKNPTVCDKVKRGDFSFNKVDEDTMESMAGVEFEIVSNTTGETHKVKMDENGIFDSRNSEVWFSGSKDLRTEPVEGRGAFPYDTYTVREIQGETNADYKMIAFTVRVSSDNVHIPLGTRDNKPIDPPEIATQLTHEGGKLAPATGIVKLTDTVYYSGLERGKSYTLAGELMDRETGESTGLMAETNFTARREEGEIDVVFEFAAESVKGKTLVAFEELYDADSVLVAEHKDPEDADQSVEFPAISTSLADDTGGKAPAAVEALTVVDRVSYTNLVPGKTYELTGTLMDKASGMPILAEDDSPIVSSTTFTPQEPSGSVDIPFTFDGRVAAGRSVVAFESLYYEGRAFAVHADLEDADQTLEVPEIGTSLAGAEGSKSVSALDTIVLQDTLSYSNFAVGREYTAYGTLMDKASGKPVVDEDGKEVRASVSFAPEEPNGTVVLEFSFRAPDLAGKSIVAFERVEVEGREYAIHADLQDADQTVHIPDIATTLTEPGGTHTCTARGKVVLTDTVAFENLVPEDEYVLSGELMDKDTGKSLGIRAEATFKPKASHGSTELRFEVDASKLADRTVVAFERLTRKGGEAVAEHRDLKDAAQSMAFSGKAEKAPGPSQLKKFIPQTGIASMGVMLLVAGGALLATALGSGFAASRKRPK